MDLRIEDDENLDEQLEHIPWSDLVVQQHDFPRWIAYVAAGALAAAAIGVVVARSLPARPSPAASPAPIAVSTPPSIPSTVVTTAPLYSEADLMALVPGAQEQLAAVRAEWFVRDYFGTGGRPAEALGVLSALPDGAVPPTGGGEGVSYVEWARTAAVQSVGANLYEATVLFGMLGGPDTASLSRLPVHAVTVVVEVAGGDATVVDLPSPASVPGGVRVAGWPVGDDELPRALVAVVDEEARLWGSDPEVVSAVGAQGGWRVVVTVTDTAGNRWPLSLWLDDSGRIEAPPWAG